LRDDDFTRRKLLTAVAAYPLYTTIGDWKNQSQNCALRGASLQPARPVLPLPGIVQNLTLKLPWTALIDQNPAQKWDDAGRHYHRTVGQQVRLVGTFSIGTDFTSGNGNVVMSDQNFLRYFANLGPEGR